MTKPLIDIRGVSKRFGAAMAPAVKGLSTTIGPGKITGLVGPDGSGKTTLLRMMAGLLLPDEGTISVGGHDTRESAASLRRDIAYMPQRFGLYEDLSVLENLRLYADLRDLSKSERENRFKLLLRFTGLEAFTGRLAGRLSGGMKQKLGLACALVTTPKLLLLDEPSVGVDPISRKELWRMTLELAGQGIGIVWSTAYLDEAEKCTDVLLMSGGKLLYQGAPANLTKRVEGQTFAIRNIQTDRRAVLANLMGYDHILDGDIRGHNVHFLVETGGASPLLLDQLGAGKGAHVVATEPRFEDAFIALLGGAASGRSPFMDRSERPHNGDDTVIDAAALTRKFGDFVAADQVSFQVNRGQVFGLIGPNGAGKSTTFKMLCGLLKPTSGTARVAGLDLRNAPSMVRGRIGYMAQGFSLYGDLSVQQNLDFFAGVYGLSGKHAKMAVARMIEIFALQDYLTTRSIELSLGYKRRLALACSVMHEPDILFLDEPTSGVDPKTRREFWGHINALVTRGVTIIVTTHFLDEAEYCDRVALINLGKIIAAGEPDTLKAEVRTAELSNPSLEDAFIAIIERAAQEVAA